MTKCFPRRASRIPCRDISHFPFPIDGHVTATMYATPTQSIATIMTYDEYRTLWRLKDDSTFYDDANMTSLYTGYRKPSKKTICGQRPFESPTCRVVLCIHAHPYAFPYTLERNDVCIIFMKLLRITSNDRQFECTLIFQKWGPRKNLIIGHVIINSIGDFGFITFVSR